MFNFVSFCLLDLEVVGLVNKSHCKGYDSVSLLGVNFKALVEVMRNTLRNAQLKDLLWRSFDISSKGLINTVSNNNTHPLQLRFKIKPLQNLNVVLEVLWVVRWHIVRIIARIFRILALFSH